GQAAGQPDIPCGDRPRSDGVAVFLPQTCVDEEMGCFRKRIGEDRIESMQAFHNSNTVTAVHMTDLARWHLRQEVKLRDVALPRLGQFPQAALQKRDI